MTRGEVLDTLLFLDGTNQLDTRRVLDAADPGAPLDALHADDRPTVPPLERRIGIRAGLVEAPDQGAAGLVAEPRPPISLHRHHLADDPIDVRAPLRNRPPVLAQEHIRE